MSASIDRRSLLKFGAATAGVVGALVGADRDGASAQSSPARPLPRFTAVLQVDGLGSFPLTAFDDLESASEVVEFRSAEGTVRKIPGRLKWPEIKLKRGVDSRLELWAWRDAAIAGTPDRRDGSIVLYDQTNLPALRFNFVNGWPAKYSGPTLHAGSNDVALEELHIAHEGFDAAFLRGGIAEAPIRTFKVEIEGISPSGFSEVSGLSSESEVIESVSGGDPVIHKRPGRTNYSNIILRRGNLHTSELWEWRKKVIEGKVEGQRKSGSIIILADDGKSEIARYNFFQAWPARWKGPAVQSTGDTHTVEEIELAVERIVRA